MALEQLKLSLEPLMVEYDLLKTELDRLNALYNEVTSEKNDSKSTTRGSTVFISQQNQVLNSISTSRVSVISKMSDIRRNIEELKIKEFNANKSLTDESGADSALVKEMIANIFSMKDDEISKLVSQQESTNEDEDVTENLAEAEALIDGFSTNDDSDTETLEEQFTTIQKVCDKEMLEVAYDIASKQFVVLSTAPTDSGTIVSDDYLEAHAKDLVDILANLEVTEIDEKLEQAVTPVRSFPLVELTED